MALEDVMGRTLSRVEVVHINHVYEHCGEQMSTIRENDLTALLDYDILILLNVLVEYVHHPDAIEEAHNDLETSWVEGHANRFFLELLIYLKLEAEGWVVAPYFDRIIRGACSDQILLDTDIHTGDGPRMETMPEIVVASLHIFVVH